MIDFTKILIPDDHAQRLMHHHALSFQRPINEDTGEYNSRAARIAVYKKMRFEYFPSGRMTLSGSWHKHFTGDHNHSDFSLTEFAECISSFCHTFELNPDDLKLLQVETGVNISTRLNPDEILKRIVSDWHGETFSRMRQRNYKSIGVELYRAEYGIKVYNKGKQYKLPENLLRFEVKVTTGKYLSRTGFHNLSDLISADAWRSLAGKILNLFDELNISEPSVTHSRLSPSKRTFLSDTERAIFWQGLTIKQRYKARKRLIKLIELHATNDLRIELRESILSKTIDLNCDDELMKMGYVFPNRAELPENENGLCFPDSYNVVNHTTEPQLSQTKYCKTCGRDISDQRAGSIFCSESKYGKAAKKCRNTDSNPRNNFTRAVARIELNPMLFDHTPFLKLSNKINPCQ